MRIKTEMEPAKARKVFEFIKADDFWQTKVVSPIGLLNKRPGADKPKIGNILFAMKNPKKPNHQTERYLPEV